MTEAFRPPIARVEQRWWLPVQCSQGQITAGLTTNPAKKTSLPLKTWIYADNTELGIDLFPPAAESFVKLEARVPAKRRSERAKRSKRAA
jgi:hypothetical protein